MGLKTTKITRYTASDGKVFYGADKKAEAMKYEESISRTMAVLERERNLLDILAFYLTDEKLLQLINDVKDLRNTDAGKVDPLLTLFDLNDDTCYSLLSYLFEDTMCASEHESFDEFIETIALTVNRLGGIDAVSAICKLYENK